MKARIGWATLLHTTAYLDSNESNYQLCKQYFDARLRVKITKVCEGGGYNEDELIISKNEWTFFTEVV